MRDLKADLELCQRATPGPWVSTGGKFPKVNGGPVAGCAVATLLFATETDARWIAEAREGWPEAIKRALAAEERVVKLEAALRLALHALTDGMEDVSPGHRSPQCAKLRAEAKRAIRQLLGPKPDSEEG